MSEVRLLIREAGNDWSGTVHGSCADRAIAALSADPVTLKDLEVACGRFEKPMPDRPILANLSAGFRDTPHDAGLVVIDLVARLVVVDSTYSSPGPSGDVAYHDGQRATDTWLGYHVDEEWLFTSDPFHWKETAEERRRERAERALFNARGVFYGRPLLEFVAQEVFAAFACGEKCADLESDTIREIHAAWLLTPRDDLGGLCPREIAVERRNHLGWDLQNQANRWSLLNECPPGLDESSFAFRYGGFGTHELVKYYDLVRELLWSCRERLTHLVETNSDAPESLTIGDFLASEVSRLEGVRDEWLKTPDPDCHGRTPRSIIDRERARLPEGVSGHDAIVDPDCPCCQMMAEMPGPVFWRLDGSEMDDDFAFDMRHRRHEEWEAEQQKWRERDRRFNAEWAERERLGVTRSGDEGEKSVWSSSFSVGEAIDLPLGVRLFAIGCHLAELITEIRSSADDQSPPQSQQLIDQLNRDFGNLRGLLQNSESSLANALIEPVIDRFTVSLASVAAVRSDLIVKCDSLTNSLAQFLDRPAPKFDGAPDDWDIPF